MDNFHKSTYIRFVMQDFCVSVIGICCDDRLGFRVLSPVIKLFFFIIYHFVYQCTLVYVKAYNAEKENPTKS